MSGYIIITWDDSNSAVVITVNSVGMRCIGQLSGHVCINSLYE